MRNNKNVTNFIFFITFILLIFISNTAKTQELSLWKNLGLYGGQINSLAIDPTNPKVMYAGSWGGDGLFKSTDKGTTWFSIPQDPPSWFRNLDINDIEIDPNDPDTIWVAFNHYVAVSHDAGETWQTFYFADDIVDPCFDDNGCDTTKSGRICYSVAVDPFDSDRVYVATGGPDSTDEYGDIFITEDGGTYWAPQSLWVEDLVWNTFYQIKFNPNKQGEIWAANRKSYISPDGLVAMTFDYFQSWYYWDYALWDDNPEPFGFIDEVLVHPLNPLRIFLCSGEGIAVKNDGSTVGRNWYWTPVATASQALCIPPKEPATIYAALSTKMAKSTDNGVTWDTLSLDVPCEFLALEPQPDNASVLFAGSVNKGVYKTTDRAKNWQKRNNGIKANAIFDTTIHPANPGAILCGTVSGIFLKSADAWLQINTNTAYAVAFHPSNPDIIYAGFGWCIGKSTDKGSTWTYFSTPDQEISNRIVSLAIDPTGAGSATIYAAVSFDSCKKGQILKIQDNGGAIDTASLVTVSESAVPVNAVALKPQNPSVIIAATGSFYAPKAPGGIYISNDGGLTWRRNFFTRKFTANCIAFDPTNPDIVYAGCGASDGTNQALLKSINGGLTWRTAQAGLPKYFAVKDIKVADDETGTVYAALYKGFSDSESSLNGTYVSMDSGKYWTRTGLSDYYVYDVNIENPEAALSRQARTLAAASIPTYTVYAGTASGLFEDQSTIAGTGIVSGMITSTSNSLIGEAYVRSSAGTGAQSNRGSYLMLVPAGQHSIQVTAPGYLQVSSATMNVNSGGATEFNITMTPSGTDVPICISEQLLQRQSDSRDLQTLRAFRDGILKKTAYGRSIISLYYGMGSQILPVLAGNERLKARCISLIGSAASSIRAAVAGKPLSLPRGFMDKASAFLMELEQASPAGLRQKIRELRCNLHKYRLDRLQESPRMPQARVR